MIFASVLGLGAVWGLMRLMRERAHSGFRIQELTLTAEAASAAAASERLKTEQAMAAAQLALATAEASKQTTNTVSAVTLSAVAVAFLLLSDERVKVNVRRVATSPSGIPIYHFAYCMSPAPLAIRVFVCRSSVGIASAIPLALLDDGASLQFLPNW